MPGAANANDVTNLATYKPSSVDDLLKGLVSTAITAAGNAWNKVKDDITAHLSLIAQQTISTKGKLLSGEITDKEADHTFSLLEINLNSALLEAVVLPYIVAQKLLDAVFSVVVAVIKNYTGLSLNFGS